jgi:hypothetical protein
MAESTDPNASAANADAGGANNPTSTTTPAAGVPAADVQAQINQALQAQQADFAKQLKEATGHSDFKAFTEAQLKQQGKLQELADANKAEAQTFKAKFEQAAVGNALLAAATEAVDPATVKDLLAGRAQVDDSGNVTIDGKPVAEAVKQLLTDKPFLAKAQGGTGSGAPNQADMAANGGKNPWSEKHFNLTEQSRIYSQDPALAEKLKAQAAA